MNEEYSSEWSRVELMVSPKCILNAIGGDTKDGIYTGLEIISSKIRELKEKIEFNNFEIMAQKLKITAEEMLKQHFGERCDEFEIDCLCCQRWKLLDELIKNPY